MQPKKPVPRKCDHWRLPLPLNVTFHYTNSMRRHSVLPSMDILLLISFTLFALYSILKCDSLFLMRGSSYSMTEIIIFFSLNVFKNQHFLKFFFSPGGYFAESGGQHPPHPLQHQPPHIPRNEKDQLSTTPFTFLSGHTEMAEGAGHIWFGSLLYVL